MLRVRASAFLAGFAVASALAMYQLQKEVWASHRTLSAQAKSYHSDLESRIIQVEKSTGVQLQSKIPEEALVDPTVAYRQSLGVTFFCLGESPVGQQCTPKMVSI